MQKRKNDELTWGWKVINGLLWCLGLIISIYFFLGCLAASITVVLVFAMTQRLAA